jgi:3-dehydroquinate dehydratase II
MPGTLFILNGPNLNLLGEREPHLYGRDTLDMIHERCRVRARTHDLDVDCRQSNYEGALVDAVHEARRKARAIIINPAGLSFYSVPLLDALKTFDGPKIEVHLTNIHQREGIYQKSIISMTSTAVICGLGAIGYELAVDAAAALLAKGKS